LDLTNLTIVDLDNETFDKAFNALHNILISFNKPFTNKLGLGLGVTYNGKVIYTDFVGRINANSTQTPDENTVISVGSITKMFTSLMMTTLADKGILKVTDPVTKYFNDDNKPAFNVLNPYNEDAGAKSVTLESLATHSSGLPYQSLCPFEAGCSEETIMELVNEIPLYHQPLTRPHYSNIGYALLGRCCERAARKAAGAQNITYESWLHDNVFAPWNMTSTGFDYPEEIKERMAVGYIFDQATGELNPSPEYGTSLKWGNPCGGMYSTTSDIMKFVTHIATRDGLLSGDGYQQYFLPGVLFSDGVSSYGRAGWEIAYANGLRTLTKDGIIGGFCSTVAIVPDLKLGVYVWSNVQLTMTEASAGAINLLVPTIISALQSKQTKPIPAEMTDILGVYTSGSSVLNISKGSESIKTGIFYGNIDTYSVWFEYDEKTTTAVNVPNRWYFRYFLDGGAYSCINLGMGGNDNGLVMFSHNDGVWTVTRYDAAFTGTKH